MLPGEVRNERKPTGDARPLHLAPERHQREDLRRRLVLALPPRRLDRRGLRGGGHVGVQRDAQEVDVEEVVHEVRQREKIFINNFTFPKRDLTIIKFSFQYQ